ncbi:MAG: RNA pseudouridine synthase [Candidatus Falkowbacteria bacterium]|nr:RNA pseudouridine synthase [Candidatus Falkowbacteria bacterium]
MKYEKIFVNDEFIVINKPAGLIAHGAEHIKEENLAEELMKEFPEIAKIGDDPERPGLMHRLDKLVSGLMVIARTQASFDNLKKQFQNRQVEKVYTALVYGKIDKDEGEINFPINRSAKGFKMAALPFTKNGGKNDTGRDAITEFSVTKKFINYTLIKVKIKTGRTHQIRVHLFAYGHPVVGDNLYSTKKTREKNKKLNTERIFLAATELTFQDLAGEIHHFKIDLPAEFNDMIKKIK